MFEVVVVFVSVVVVVFGVGAGAEVVVFGRTWDVEVFKSVNFTEDGRVNF